MFRLETYNINFKWGYVLCVWISFSLHYSLYDIWYGGRYRPPLTPLRIKKGPNHFVVATHASFYNTCMLETEGMICEENI